MKYIKLFDKLSDFESVKYNLDRPNVSLIQENNQVEYIAASSIIEPAIDYSKEYFTIEALEDGLTAKLSANACEYCIDNGEWNTLAKATNTVSINKGQTLSFRGNLTPTSSNGIGTFTISKKCNVKGNIMSLLYKDDFTDKTDLTGKSYTFKNLFLNCSTIIDALYLVLPATILINECYSNMFEGCTCLTVAPELPATTLTEYCYYCMFLGCASLTQVHKLPATMLAESCYSSMFYGCTGLTVAPELPATTLTAWCYEYMFSGCTGLTVAPELPATTLANSCYQYMFQGCTGLTVAPELPATTLIYGCYECMFEGCTGLTVAPELSAITLAQSCYYGMFRDCSNLNYIKALFTTTPSNLYTNKWVSGVSSTGTFVKSKDATWNVIGVSGIPKGWIVQTV